MIWVVDVSFLMICFVSLAAWNPLLAVMVLLVNLLFYFQFGKGTLLYSKGHPPLLFKEKIKALGAAVILTSALASLKVIPSFFEESKSIEALWSDDLFPLFLGVLLLLSLLMVSMIVERKRR